MDRPNTSKGFATATEVNCNSVLCKIRVGTRWPLIGCRGKAIVQYRVNFTRGKLYFGKILLWVNFTRGKLYSAFTLLRVNFLRVN